MDQGTKDWLKAELRKKGIGGLKHYLPTVPTPVSKLPPNTLKYIGRGWPIDSWADESFKELFALLADEGFVVFDGENVHLKPEA